ncbi:MAG: hypothetical protein ACJ763_00510 [Bdellovibrionia bacterium]
MRTRLGGISHAVVLIALLVAPQALWVPCATFAAPFEKDTASQTVKSPTLQEFEHGIADRLKRVDEFRFIEQEAAKLGVRAWLFGGTAAGYAHYVKWDMQREKGDPRFQKDRFDYDYTNIYRSTQDLDIVIDGDASQAQKLQATLQERYPHLQGSKTAWEVRLLTQDMGDKLAILNNPDFLNQHTDSNSTGLIEITKPKAGDSVVRDVRDWNSREPFFLKDVHEGKLHYYFSSNHKSTKFAKEGRNPPILSVIRYLTKAFQYELEVRPEELKSIKKVIAEFDPKKDTENSYVSNWIEKNGKKLIQNAVNIEYAWDTLEELGLRKKLIAIKDDPNTVETLAWWMNKEPLRTRALAKGFGKTARELGLDIVAHETNSFLAYESITRAHTGDPNVLISRNDAVGEAAHYGNGFYTKIGKEGARGTGLTIRFHLNPEARENVDFIRESDANFIIVRNKAALKVIPESLNVGPVEYFEMLAQDQAAIDHSDLGILEKLKRRIGAKLSAASESEIQEILKIVKNEIINSQDLKRSAVLKAWFDSPQSSRWPEIVDWVVKHGTADSFLVESVLSQSRWLELPQWSRWISELLHRKVKDVRVAIASRVLSKPEAKAHPEWVDLLLGHGDIDRVLARDVLSQPHWKDRPGWVDDLLKRGTADEEISRFILVQPDTIKAHPEWIDLLMARGKVDETIMTSILTQPESANHPEWLERFSIRDFNARMRLIKYVFSMPHWKTQWPVMERLVMDVITHPELYGAEVDRAADVLGTVVLSQPHWIEHPEFIKSLMNKRNWKVDVQLIRNVFSQKQWAAHPELLERFVKTTHVMDLVAADVLSKPLWKDHPEFVEIILNRSMGRSGMDLVSLPQWKDHSEFVIQLMKRPLDSDQIEYFNKKVLSQPHWMDHPELRRLTGGLPPTYKNLKVGMKRAEQGRGPAFSIRGCIYNMLNKRLAVEANE